MAARFPLPVLSHRLVTPADYLRCIADACDSKERAGPENTGWTRIMRTMAGFSRPHAARFVGDEYMRPLGPSAIEFYCEKSRQRLFQSMCICALDAWLWQASRLAPTRDCATPVPVA